MLPQKNLLLLVLFTTALLILSFVKGHDGEGHAIVIPTQAEGVTHAAGSLFFASDARRGGVTLVDAKTQFVTMAIPAATVPNSRVNAGMDYNPNLGLLFVSSVGAAFGFNTSFTVYDMFTSTTVAECAAGGVFVNDVFATDDYAYFTESSAPLLYRLEISALPNCRVDTLPLPEPAFSAEPGVTKANGIYPYADGLLVVHSTLATIFWVDLEDSAGTFQTIFPEGSLQGADGIELVTMRKKKGELIPRKQPLLFVTQSVVSQVSIWKLRISENEGSIKYSSKRNITSATFASPTTVAVSPTDDLMVVANFNAMELPPPQPLPEDAPPFTVSAFWL